MKTGKILVSALLVAALVFGFGFIAYHYLTKSQNSCAEATEDHAAAVKQYETEAVKARELLNFFNDENSFGYSTSDEATPLIKATREALSEAPKAIATCSSAADAKAITRATREAKEHTKILTESVQKLTEGVLNYAAPLISEKNGEYRTAITEALASAKASLAKANTSEGYGKVKGSLNLLMGAQRLVDSPPEIPEVPSELKSLDDLRAANATLDRISEIKSNAEHYSTALKGSIDKYSDELDKKKEEMKKEEEAKKRREEAEQKSSCNDIIVVGKQCTNYTEIQYLASNGWDPDSAIQDAQSEGCASIKPDSNPCGN
ncbi:hypothetical protein [Actinomyces sp.]|uniref:hypothetical protein n=1 Tax=Actinomyces sp. TaxID=29317 RepID=UPI002908539E|nr:hypothetical protein [Actinomyces sp.]MDU5569199.1 hypothetical protein [Actinomyces sp.]